MGSEEYFATSRTNLKQKAARGGSTTAASQALKFAITIGTTAVMARLLSPADYGLVAMVTVITGFIGNFNNLGLSTATIQVEDVDHEQVSTLFWLNAAAGMAITVIIAMLAPALSWVYGEPRLVPITIALAPVFLFIGLGVQHRALLNRQMRFGALAAVEIVAAAGSSALAIVCASRGFGYHSLVIAQLASAALSVPLSWWLCGWRPGKPGQLSKVYPLLRFGGHMTGFQAVNYFSRNGDNFLIGRFHGSEELGLYSRAYNLLLLPLTQIISPIAAVGVPALSRVRDEQFRHAFIRLARVSCVLTMPFVAFTLGTADDIVRVFLGDRWHRASDIFVWLGVLGLVQPIASTTGLVFVTQGRTGEQLRVALINGLLSILSFIVGLRWGAVGVAAAYTISGLLVRVPLVFWYAGRAGAVKTRDFYDVLGPYLGASVAGLLLTLGLRQVVQMSPLVGMVSGAATSALGFLLALLVSRNGRDGLRDVVDMIQSARKPRT